MLDHEQKRKFMRQALRDARLAAGLTQVQLAARLGQPQSFVSKVESGARRLDVVELIAFCASVGITVQPIITALSGEAIHDEA